MRNFVSFRPPGEKEGVPGRGLNRAGPRKGGLPVFPGGKGSLGNRKRSRKPGFPRGKNGSAGVPGKKGRKGKKTLRSSREEKRKEESYRLGWEEFMSERKTRLFR